MCKVPVCFLYKLFRVKLAEEEFFIKSKTLFTGCSYDDQQYIIGIQKISNHHIQHHAHALNIHVQSIMNAWKIL